jgi:hypothetical protein
VINNIKITNGKKEEEQPKKQAPQELKARIRGKMYGRRTIN